MKPSVKFAALLIITLSAAVTFSRLASAQTTSPDAYVYVANRVLDGSVELDGFSVDSAGALTPLPGSPFVTSSALSTLAHSAQWLYASDGISIYSFSIASNGALTLMQSKSAQPFNSPGATITALFLDRTMRTLYARSTTSAGTHSILTFQKNLPTGVLRYYGTTDHPGQPIRARGPGFIGNDQYAYTAVCYDPWFAAQRINDGISLEGTLSPFSINPVIPSNPTGNYCAFTSAPDQTNNLAVAL